MSESSPRTLLQHGLQTATLNALIALAIMVFDDRRSLGVNMVYSQCIGLLIWLLIEAGLYLLVQDRARHWRRLVAIVPLSVVLGYVLGTLGAELLLHTHGVGYLSAEPRKFAGLLVVSLLAGAAMTYLFLSRAQLQAERQRAEVALRLAAEARLKLLESQLEPHMLFNTLANLRVLIGLEPARAQTMLDHLIAYLRATLSASRASTHTLEQEFARLQDYLELMAVRMGPRLQFSLTLPPELRQQVVPALLLQPLVENSIQHGLEPQVAGGRVDISASVQGTQLCLQVQDNGVGLAAPVVDVTDLAGVAGATGVAVLAVQKGATCETGTAGAAGSTDASGRGFGLRQVRERLHTLYGSAGSLQVENQPGGGTCSRIVLPLQA